MAIRFEPGAIRAVAGAVGGVASGVLGLESSGEVTGNSGFETTATINSVKQGLLREAKALGEAITSDSDALTATAAAYENTEDDATRVSQSYFRSV